MPGFKKPVAQRKTTWAAAGGLLGAAAAFATGTMSAPEAITVAFQSLLALTLRSAIASDK